MKNKKMILGIIITFLIVLGIICIKPIKHYVIRNDSFNWLAYGVKQQYDSKELNVQEEIKFNIKGVLGNNQDRLINDIFNNTTIRLDMNYDRNNFKNLTKVKLKNKNEDFGNLEFFSNKEGVVLKCSDVFNGNLYLDYKDICQFFNPSKNCNSINLENYLPLFDISKDKYAKKINKDIFKILKNNLDNKIERNENKLVNIKFDGKEKNIKCNELKISLNIEDIKIILNELEKFSKEDPNVKLFLENKFNEFISIATKNNDLDKFGLTDEDIKNTKEPEKLHKDFQNGVEENSNKVIKEIDKNNGTCDFRVDIYFRFDNEDKIRNILSIYNFKHSPMEFSIEQNVNINYSIDKQILDSSNYSKDIKITELKENNLNSDMDKYIENLENRLIKLYPELNNIYNNGYSNTDFNNTDYINNYDDIN